MAKLLLIEDDLAFLRLLENFLSKHEHSVVTGSSVRDAVKALGNETFEAAILDYRLPDGTGLDILEKINRYTPGLPVIIMTSFNDVRTAIKAIQAGAKDYILKPIHHEELMIQLSNILSIDSKAKHEIKHNSQNTHIEGNSPNAQTLHEVIRLVAPTNLSVIIQGESGTGKEFVARMIHRNSSRSQGPFVAVDCGVLNDDLGASILFGHVKGAFTGAIADTVGVFQQGAGGTLFLDEIGNLPYQVQVKLLRALQERSVQRVGSGQSTPVDVRIIVATNEGLSRKVEEHTFREDLFHRLHEFDIVVPPLRERGEDIKIFAEHFRQQANEELGRNTEQFDHDVIETFLRYRWPGNLRELKNVVRRAVLSTSSKIVSMNSIPAEMARGIENHPSGEPLTLKSLQEIQEKEFINKMLVQAGFNKSKAAKLLQIDRKTLYMKMKKYNLEN